MAPAQVEEPVEDSPIQEISIEKGKSGLGLSIVAAKGTESDFTGYWHQISVSIFEIDAENSVL